MLLGICMPNSCSAEDTKALLQTCKLFVQAVASLYKQDNKSDIRAPRRLGIFPIGWE